MSRGRDEIGYKDVESEHERVLCEVIQKDGGEVPLWLGGGTFYRQCGGAFLTAEREGASGLIDGLAHIASFAFDKNGKVWFSNKFMKTPDFDRFKRTGKRDWIGAEFGPAPFLRSRGLTGVLGGALYDRVRKSVPFLSRSSIQSYQGVNPNVVIWRLNDGSTLAAATEGPKGEVCVFDSGTLETTHRVVTMPRGTVFQTAAHYYESPSSSSASSSLHVALSMRPSVSLSAGVCFQFEMDVYAGDTRPFERVHSRKWTNLSWSSRNKVRESERVPYIHTTVETKNFFIVPFASLRVNYEGLLSRDFRKGFFGLFDTTSVPLGFYVLRVDRRQKSSVKLTPIGDFFLVQQKGASSNCRMFWHVANAFEDEESRIVIDATSPPNMNTSTTESYRTNAEYPCPLKRFVIDLREGTVRMSELVLPNGPDMEFPNVNPLVLRQRHRYIYALAKPYVEGSFVMKIDTRTNQMITWNLAISDDIRASEPIFVPSPDGNDEDDGVVLTVATDMRRRRSFLFVLDGKTMKERVRVVAPIVVNFGLHNYFFYGGDKRESMVRSRL